MTKESVDKLNETSKLLGFDLSLFPGIPIATIPLYFIFSNYKNSILDSLGLNMQSNDVETLIIAIPAILTSIIIYWISGRCLDPIYDNFYKEKRDKNSQLNMLINAAREKWKEKNTSIDTNKLDVNKLTREKLERENEFELKKIRQILSVSKLFRILVIPLLALGIFEIINSNIVWGIICIVIAVISLFMSFDFRAEYSKALYRWYLYFIA